MENGIVRRISLSGSLRGSALLRESGDETEIELTVRGLKKGASLFTAADGRIAATPVTGEKLRIRQTGICAAVLAENGRLLSGGFTGSCAADRKKLLDEIRIRSAESVRPAEKDVPPEKKPAAKPRAAVTGNILERAQRLFSMLGELGAAAEKPLPEASAESGFTGIPNPFPKTFPGSVWQRKDGDARLFGTVTADGRQRRYVAVPIDLREGRARFRGIRPVIGRDGKRYLVEQTE